MSRLTHACELAILHLSLPELAGMFGTTRRVSIRPRMPSDLYAGSATTMVRGKGKSVGIRPAQSFNFSTDRNNELATFQGFHHIGIVVESIEASTAWYIEHFGFERLYHFGWPGVQVALIGREGLKLELFQNEQATPAAAERRSTETNLRIGGINHFAIQVQDLDTTVKVLQQKGVEVVSLPRDVPNSGGSRFAFIHDNEQMLVELLQPA